MSLCFYCSLKLMTWPVELTIVTLPGFCVFLHFLDCTPHAQSVSCSSTSDTQKRASPCSSAVCFSTLDGSMCTVVLKQLDSPCSPGLVYFQASSSAANCLLVCRAGVHLPTVMVKFKDITVDAEVYKGNRALPTLTNSYRNFVEVSKPTSRLQPLISWSIAGIDCSAVDRVQ